MIKLVNETLVGFFCATNSGQTSVPVVTSQTYLFIGFRIAVSGCHNVSNVISVLTSLYAMSALLRRRVSIYFSSFCNVLCLVGLHLMREWYNMSSQHYVHCVFA